MLTLPCPLFVLRYEKEGRAKRVVKAQQVWHAIIESQTETGTPYMLYKDACNRKSNQQNLGTIKSSNLCTEIVEYTSKDEVWARRYYFIIYSFIFFVCNVIIYYIVILNALFNVVCSQVAVCNLASIALNMYVTPERTFDFKKLTSVTKVIVRNLNKIIDINYYPVPEVCFLLRCFFPVDHAAGSYVLCVNKWLLSPALQAERSNMRHRPIGIGVQGLADAFILMRYPFESSEAQLLNIQIFETIYYAALEASCELAEKLGTYETYAGSPVSKGVSRFHNVSNPS